MNADNTCTQRYRPAHSEPPSKGPLERPLSSTPQDPSIGTMNGLEEIAASKEVKLLDFLPQVALIVHGTTITTNAVLTGVYAKTDQLLQTSSGQ